MLNRAHDTEVRGSDLRFNPSGVEASDTNHLLVQDNDASDSLQTGFEIGNGVGIRILDNVAHRAGGAGIGMEGATFDALGNPVGGALIEGNRDRPERRERDHRRRRRPHDPRQHRAQQRRLRHRRRRERTSTAAATGRPATASSSSAAGSCASRPTPRALIGPDVTAPVTVIDAGAARPVGRRAPRFVFSATDATPTAPPTRRHRDGVRVPARPAARSRCPSRRSPTSSRRTRASRRTSTRRPTARAGSSARARSSFTTSTRAAHHFEVRATDFADNKDITPATHDWDVELRPEEEGPGVLAPETRIASGPPSTTTTDSATFRFAGSDDMTPGPDLRFECKLDPPGRRWESCTTPRVYDGPRRRHAHVRGARDRPPGQRRPRAGRDDVDDQPAAARPRSRPTRRSTPGPDRTTVQTGATFTFSSDDPDATFECRLNSAAGVQRLRVPARADRRAARRPRARGPRDRPRPATSIRRRPRTTGRSAPPPVPTFVHCGKKVTRSILVRNDLVDCLFDGLIVDADGITIDLDGHTIDGKGLGAGVRNAGFDNVTIKNGRDRRLRLGRRAQHRHAPQRDREHAARADAGGRVRPRPHRRSPTRPCRSSRPTRSRPPTPACATTSSATTR